MSDETTSVAVEGQQQTETVNPIIAEILNVGKPATVSKASVASQDTAQTSATETTQSPAKETVVDGKSDKSSTETLKTDATTDTKTVVEDSPKIDISELAEQFLGIPKPQEETVEVIKQKYANSTKEALKKHAEIKELNETLKASGLEIVRDGENKPILTVAKDYEDKFDVNKELEGLNLKLSEMDLDKIVENPDNQKEILNGLIKKALLAYQAKHPAVKPRPTEQPPLSDEQKYEIFTEFASAKTRLGTPMFPDANDPKIVPYAQVIANANTPDMVALREVANHNPTVHSAMLKLIYFQAKDLMRMVEAKEADARKLIEETKKKLNNSVIPSAGDVSTPATTMSKSSGSGNKIVESILNA